ncbi:hypothetical protein AVEN_159909-1 [Araneus ventricosus]|uniref:Integrase catalytic domain-containing protein n=1 Tax=Araneus ventricosus TaxID=182803 RepID=A0A4Y2E5C3_ARAVE|nr:hypothetical protein AVEN_159909-1 [Araneus ventricosus]
MDYFTKWPEAIPIADQEASTVTEELARTWTSRYGVAMILHSDQGADFNSALFTQHCKLLGILETRTTALHLESHSMVVRFNRTIFNHLSLFVSKNQNDWDSDLPLFLLSYKARTMKRPDSLLHRCFSFELYDFPVISSLHYQVIRLPRLMNTLII